MISEFFDFRVLLIFHHQVSADSDIRTKFEFNLILICPQSEIQIAPNLLPTFLNLRLNFSGQMLRP